MRGVTARALLSLRRVLPGAHVILSTWKDSNVRGLEHDHLVLSDDPGPCTQTDLRRIEHSNIHRQIVSTQAGLSRVSRPYVLKWRTDIALQHAGFLDYFDRFPARIDEGRVFEHRVLVLDHFSQNPRRAHPRPFHPSDMVSFGLAQDIRHLWDVPLSTTRAGNAHPDLPPEYANCPLTRLMPEQYVWTSVLNRHSPFTLESDWHCPPDLQRMSELSIANNFVILRRNQFGARLLKHRFDLRLWSWCYSHSDWLQIYAEYCAPKT